LNMTQAVALPASGDIEYPYEIVPTSFKEDRWVQMAEVLPTLRSNVHHAVRRGLIRKIAAALTWTDSDVLLVYAPGSSPEA